jgi:single-stranded DNA-binding protein
MFKKNNSTVLADGTINCNNVKICGIIKSAPIFSHETRDGSIKFYKIFVQSTRKSDITNEIPCLVSDKHFDISQLTEGTKVFVQGQFRSFNLKDQEMQDKPYKLLLFVYCFDIHILTEEEFEVANSQRNNHIVLMGYVCKNPIYRKTPSEKEITDLHIAVNRNKGKSADYIPCISWGKAARFASKLNIGDFIIVEGRVQSRLYDKKDEEGNVLETKVAYEVSANRIYQAGVLVKDEKEKK